MMHENEADEPAHRLRLPRDFETLDKQVKGLISKPPVIQTLQSNRGQQLRNSEGIHGAIVRLFLGRRI
jgi:hypothetical protein